MIDLAVCMALQEAGYGVYGDTLFFGVSPVLDSGSVSSTFGLYVNSQTVDIQGDLYTDSITISSRYDDVLEQGLTMYKLLWWVNNDFRSSCSLSCEPISPLRFGHVRVYPCKGVDFDAIDGQGRWVKSLRFDVSYKLLPIFD